MITDFDRLKEHVDTLIEHWRSKRDSGATPSERWTAICYVDAFQSLRANVFGGCLPAKSHATVIVNCVDARKEFEEELSQEQQNESV